MPAEWPTWKPSDRNMLGACTCQALWEALGCACPWGGGRFCDCPKSRSSLGSTGNPEPARDSGWGRPQRRCGPVPVLELLCPAGAQAPSGQRSVCLGFTASLMLKECQARVRARHARVSVRGECYTLVAWLREVCSVHFFI